MREILQQIIVDSLTADLPILTRRDIHIPKIAGKALAVIGMRRSGKTTFMWQCLTDRLETGTPRSALLFLNFEDERLAGMQGADLQWVLEDYFRLQPQWRDTRTVTFFFDEIQVVPGWEAFTRRLLDSEKVDLFLSGSSAKLLSREVATSMRGRAMEVTIFPFSFRESLRHTDSEPLAPWDQLGKAARSDLDHRLRDYLAAGGFPEVQGISGRDRNQLLHTYVDVAVLRDIIERYRTTNTVALRWLQRQLLANPASLFSIQKFHDVLRSQGIPVSKDTLHAFLGHLEDTFLIRTISIHAESERQRMVNPRKAYPVDPGLIPVYERTGRPNLGQALESVILVELERRGYSVSYVRTPEGLEVDFMVCDPFGKWRLIQVCTDLSNSATWEREVRALVKAAKLYPEAEPILLTLDSVPPNPPLPESLAWQPAIGWLLADESGQAGMG
jgi:hypothetical protein